MAYVVHDLLRSVQTLPLLTDHDHFIQASLSATCPPHGSSSIIMTTITEECRPVGVRLHRLQVLLAALILAKLLDLTHHLEIVSYRF